MATLTTTISESVNINGKPRGNEIAKTFTVSDVMERVITVPTSKIRLYKGHNTTPQGDVFDFDLIKYARITNLDSSNFVTLKITNSESDEALFKLAAGESFVLNGHASTTSFKEAGGVDAALHSISIVEATADTASCQVEIFVAST